MPSGHLGEKAASGPNCQMQITRRRKDLWRDHHHSSDSGQGHHDEPSTVTRLRCWEKRMSTCVPTEEINSHWTKIAHFIWKQMSFYIQTKLLYILKIQYEHLCKQEAWGPQRPTQAHITRLRWCQTAKPNLGPEYALLPNCTFYCFFIHLIFF